MASKSVSSSSPSALRSRTHCQVASSDPGAAMRPIRLAATAARWTPLKPRLCRTGVRPSQPMAARPTASTPTERGRVSCREAMSTSAKSAEGDGVAGWDRVRERVWPGDASRAAATVGGEAGGIALGQGLDGSWFRRACRVVRPATPRCGHTDAASPAAAGRSGGRG